MGFLKALFEHLVGCRGRHGGCIDTGKCRLHVCHIFIGDLISLQDVA